jgi:starch-binding outer membrane protein, SusD/RagB family
MKKTNFLRYILSALVLIAFSACEDFLDVKPQQSIDAEMVFEVAADVENALYGAYERIAGPQLYAGTSVFHSDLVASEGLDSWWSGTFVGYRQMEEKAMDPNEGTITAKWSRAYQAINTVNNVLANLSLADADSRDRIEGEARFIRGIMHFELVRLYASPYVAGQANDQPGVPIMTTPTIRIEDAQNVSRATVNNVYQAILTDLTTAKQLLSELPKNAGANSGRATSPVVAAFLARVYLAMENWEKAAEEADYVITNFGGYEVLNIVPRNAFNNIEYTREDVFMIRQDKTSNAGQANDGITTFFASLDGLGRGDVDIEPDHFNRYEEGDLRSLITDDPSVRIIEDVPQMFYVGVGTKRGRVRTSKWGKYDANVPVIRLAEMILTRAEANFRKGGTPIGAEPIDDINAIRNRAGVSDWSAEDLTLDLIREERYRELCFEGHALHDLRRFRGSVVAPRGPYRDEELQWNDPRLVLPIPQREIDTNPNLVQNTGY